MCVYLLVTPLEEGLGGFNLPGNFGVLEKRTENINERNQNFINASPFSSPNLDGHSKGKYEICLTSRSWVKFWLVCLKNECRYLYLTSLAVSIWWYTGFIDVQWFFTERIKMIEIWSQKMEFDPRPRLKKTKKELHHERLAP